MGAIIPTNFQVPLIATPNLADANAYLLQMGVPEFSSGIPTNGAEYAIQNSQTQITVGTTDSGSYLAANAAPPIDSGFSIHKTVAGAPVASPGWLLLILLAGGVWAFMHFKKRR